MSAPLDVDAVERGLAGLLATHPHLGGLSDALALIAEVRRLRARLALVPPKLCGRCEATLHPERRERTLCRRCQTDAIREGVSRAWRNRRRAALAPTPDAGGARG